MGETIKGFPWRRGMSSNGAVLSDEDIVAIKQGDSYGMAPDREDPATVGAFLGAVREAFGEPRLSLISFTDFPSPEGKADALSTVTWAVGYYEWTTTTGTFVLRTAENRQAWGTMYTPHTSEWDAIEAAWNVRPGRAE